jgi:hypothetical protein
MKISVITGSILGIFCIIGASLRMGNQIEVTYLFSLWFNRLLMGILIGAPWTSKKMINAITRGAFFGFFVSFQFFIFTNFTDVVSFVAGIIYGIIIELVVFQLTHDKM